MIAGAVRRDLSKPTGSKASPQPEPRRSGKAFESVDCVTGPVDLRGTAGEGLGYEELRANSPEIEFYDSLLRIRVLDLGTIIFINEEIGSGKDLAVLLRCAARSMS